MKFIMSEKREDIAGFIDMDSGLARVRGNKGLYVRMLKLFLSSAEFAKLEDALAENDYHTASEAAHSIKGIAGNLSFDPLFKISGELMTQLRQGSPAKETLENYRTTLKGTIKAAETNIAAE